MWLRDLASYFRLIDGHTNILSVSTNDVIVCTNSETVRNKLTHHLRGNVPMNTREGPSIQFSNMRIVQSNNYVTMNQNNHIKNIAEECC